MEHSKSRAVSLNKSDLSHLAIALFNPGSGYDGILTEPRHLQALDWEIPVFNRLNYCHNKINTIERERT
jgi:hypothetical protein